MKSFFYTLITLFISTISFSQIITFECNNELIIISFDEIANNPNAYLDWNDDSLVNEEDYIIYLNELYDCDENSDVLNNQGCFDDAGNLYNVGEVLILSDDDCENYTCVPNDTVLDGYIFVINFDLYPEVCETDQSDSDSILDFVFDCNGEEIIIELSNLTDSTDYETYIESVLSTYDCEEWDGEDDNWDEEDDNWDGEDDNWDGEDDNWDGEDDNWDGEDDNWDGEDNTNSWEKVEWLDDDWSDFEWFIYWDDLDLNIIDWINVPWDIIIDLDIAPEDFIDYIFSIFGQTFNWTNFIDNHANNVSIIENLNNPIIITHNINLLGQNVIHYNQIIIQYHNNGFVNKQFLIK